MNKFYTLALSLVAIFCFNTVTAQNIVRSNFTGVIVPQYVINGSNSTNPGKIPFIFRATVSGLLPNYTYTYYNVAAPSSSIGGTTVYGQSVLINSTTLTISYDANPVGNNAGESFTTDLNGNYTGWFGFATNGATPFNTSGNQVWPVIVLKGNGNQIQYRFMLDLANVVTVKIFGTTSGSSTQVSSITGSSLAVAENIITLYDNETGSGRPLSASFVENDGVTSATYGSNPTWYPDGTAGAWGAIIPNNNGNGVRRIEHLDIANGTLIGCATDADGSWPTGPVNTVNPSNGNTTTLAISVTDAPLIGCTSTQPVTSLSFSNACFTDATVGWTAPITYAALTNDIIVFAKAGSAITIGTPTVNISTYSDNASFGSGTAYENDAAAYAIYKGDASSINLSNLTSGTTYHFLVYNVNSGVNYSSGITSSGTTLSALNNVSAVTTSVGNGLVTIDWSAPTGCYDEVFIIAKQGGAPTTTPTGDGTSYVVSSTYADPNALTNTGLNAGEYAVFLGVDTMTTVSGLTNSSSYTFKIFTRKGTVWSTGTTVTAIPVPAIGDFQTVQSGNWNNYTTWEIFNGTSWLPTTAGQFPNSPSNDATILNTHTVTLNVTNVDVQRLTVNVGGKLYCNSGTVRYIYINSTPLTCDGIIGNYPTDDGVSFGFRQSGTTQLNGSSAATDFTCANMIKANVGTSVNTGLTINRDLYITGAGTQLYNAFTSGATQFNVTVSANKTVTVTDGDVAIDGANGSGNANGSANQQRGTLTVNGTLDIQVGTLYLTTNNAGLPAVTVRIGANGTINTATIDASVSNTGGHSFQILNSGLNGGRLNITDAGGFTSFSTTFNSFALNLYSTVEYSATNGVQDVRTELDYSKLEINNASGVNTVGTPTTVTVNNQLIFTDGKITTGGDTVYVTSSLITAITGHNTSRYVFGNLRREIASNGTFDFPVGTATNYQLIQLDANNLTGVANIFSRFTSPAGGAAPAITVNGAAITTLLNAGVWTLTPDQQPTGGNYDLHLYERGNTNFAAGPAAYKKYTGLNRVNSASAWLHSGITIANNTTISGGTTYVPYYALTSFSDFGIGYGSAVLPVTLTTFTATLHNDADVLVSWRTESEIDCDYFDVERSLDGKTFEYIGTIAGNGTTIEAHSYSLIDENPIAGVNYYRLRQVDFNDTENYSPIRAVELTASNSSDVVLYPVPAENVLYVTGLLANDLVTVYDLTGKLIVSQVTDGTLVSFDLNSLSAGTYLMKIENKTGLQTKIFSKL